MKAGNLLIAGAGIGAGLLALNFWGKARAAEKLNFQVLNARLEKSNKNPLIFRVLLTLGVTNPTGETLAFYRFSGSIFLANSKAGTFDIKAPENRQVIIAANRQTPITFPVNVSGFDILGQIIDLISNKGQLPTAKIEGSILLGALSFPVSEIFDLKQK